MKIIHQSFDINYSYPVVFTRDVFNEKNKSIEQLLGSEGTKKRILIIMDAGVFDATPGLMDKIEMFAERNRDILEFISSPFIMKGGEACKNDPKDVNTIHELINRHRICRHSFILAIGGGAVLDAAGYAAATGHRGIRLIRMPTTTLAQNDAGVGVKNGVNCFGRKNFIGTFAPPFAIINDFDFIDTLSARNKRAGISEAVKVALIKDKPFFDFLYEERKNLACFVPEVMEEMIIRCAEIHIEHIGTSGDPFEFGSSRPLDFGHWAAHKIEELTGGQILHGEAVAMGIALDAIYSRKKGLISDIELYKIITLLEDIGFDLYHWSIGWMDVDNALKEFQEHLGGKLTIPLLHGIGQKTEVHDIDTSLLRKCVNILAKRSKEKEKQDGYRKESDVIKRSSRTIFP